MKSEKLRVLDLASKVLTVVGASIFLSGMMYSGWLQAHRPSQPDPGAGYILSRKLFSAVVYLSSWDDWSYDAVVWAGWGIGAFGGGGFYYFAKKAREEEDRARLMKSILEDETRQDRT